MHVRIEHLGNQKFGATVRGHYVVCDQPVENGGTDEGPTPPEFLLVSLGTCAGHYAATYLKNKGLNLPVTIAVESGKLTAPARLGGFRIVVEVPGLPPEHEAGLLRNVNACLIKNTLLNTPRIETVIGSAIPVA